MINKIAERAYASAMKRGKIKTYLDITEVAKGLSSEVQEVFEASEHKASEHLPEYTEIAEELADVILVSFTELRRRNVNVEEILLQKMHFNENRKD